ncbi:hypothetical protein BH11GEM2_BH11GEM2_20450 [soil metagenome]
MISVSTIPVLVKRVQQTLIVAAAAEALLGMACVLNGSGARAGLLEASCGPFTVGGRARLIQVAERDSLLVWRA